MTATTKNPSWTAAQVSKIEEFANAQTDKRITNEQIKTVFTQDPLFSEKSVSMLRGKILNLGYYSIVKKVVGTAEGKAPAKCNMSKQSKQCYQLVKVHSIHSRKQAKFNLSSFPMLLSR